MRRLAIALFFFTVFATAADKRAITEKDIFQFQWIGDPQVSPDNSRVLFVKVVVNAKHDGYETSLWTVPSSGAEAPRRLTSGKRDGSPHWSPDGKSIIFTRSVEKDGKPGPAQLFLLSLSGGEPQQLTDMLKGAGNPVWSPDGKQVAFLSSTSPEDIEKAKRKVAKDCAPEQTAGESAPAGNAAGKPCPEEHESDVRVITRAVYRFNEQGYTDPKHPSHVWVVGTPANSEDKPQPRQLTRGKFEEGDIFWSPDSSRIYYTTILLDEPYYELPRADLYSVAAAGGDPVKVLGLKIDINAPALSPDGKRLAFHSSSNEPVRSYSQSDLYLIDLSPNAQPRNLTAEFDWDIGGGLTGDQAPPRAGGRTQPVWSQDGSSLVDIVAKEGRTNLWRFPASGGKPSEVTKGDQAVMRFTSADDGNTFVALISTPVAIGDLFLVSGTNVKRITDINQKLFSELNLTAPEEIWYQSFDGKRIQSWAQKPPDFNPATKYPLILNIHGGPHAAYGYTFSHEFQWMAAKGYVVLYPNPRGSTSYGQEFGNIIQYNYPGDDHKDLMAGVDELIKRGYIDQKKLGITGGSGGGVLTNWAVTQTNRFAAAVSQRDISDWTSWWYTADFTLFQASWFKAPPFQDPEDYRRRSAITFVDKIHTPIAFILGETDYRTPPTSGGEQIFRALKYLKRPTAMVRFPGESHELSRSGQPWHRVERLQYIVGWFDKYLMGKDVPAFADVMLQEVSVPAGAAPTDPKKSPPKY
ncbi:MAG TPA: S9 family peptidase [Terriglobales bacterium]|nr:S9 family peptidase [Terriglobales bacterium]